jgi:UDP-N-acetylmuramoyl-L-alanyl-D-glutamate--2,6-diaminopimelate ligase
MGPVAARFYGDPTAELAVVGVTGTNGKTTTAYLVRALLEAAGVQTGLLGTVTSVIGGRERPVERTTPEAIELQRDFRAMLDAGDRACAMEVSSHALALGRTGGIRFAAAIFTNLTQDHLDFHPSMEDYFLAKRALFGTGPGSTMRVRAGEETVELVVAQAAPGVSVVNVGDPHGRRLATEIEGAPVTFAVEADADYSARDLSCDASGCRFELRTPIGDREAALPMPGVFNVENALGALAAVNELIGIETGIPRADCLNALIAALERGMRVPGRFERVDAGQSFGVLVDYAHTPDSLENVLRSVRELTGGRVICVFGAGGDRDRGKRPLMGEAAARLADVAIVTSDNPRSESPEAIVAEIVAGIGEGRAGGVRVEIDRRAAIELAVGLAREGDVVVIAGKGHEQGQELAGGMKVPFDDRAVAREALEAGAGRTVVRPMVRPEPCR